MAEVGAVGGGAGVRRLGTVLSLNHASRQDAEDWLLVHRVMSR